MTMTPRERMLTALEGGTPDRMPATVHQWQTYHLDKYLDGISALEAFRKFGLDAAITFFTTDQVTTSEDWQVTCASSRTESGTTLARHTVVTPGGTLTEAFESNDWTSWIVEHLAQSDRDLLARLGVQVPTDHLAFDELRPRLVSAVRKLDPDRLDQRVDAHPLAGTLGSLISLAAVHTAFHTGQVSTIRRSLGYPPKF